MSLLAYIKTILPHLLYNIFSLLKCILYQFKNLVYFLVPKFYKIIRNNINSYNTVLELKSIFKESVNLHFIDKENNSFYKNVDDAFIINKIGEKF